MNASIDPVQFGRMIEAMERLEKRLHETDEQLQSTDAALAGVRDRLEFLESRYALGKWGAGGLVLLLGFAVFGVKQTLVALLGFFVR